MEFASIQAYSGRGMAHPADIMYKFSENVDSLYDKAKNDKELSDALKYIEGLANINKTTIYQEILLIVYKTKAREEVSSWVNDRTLHD